MKIFCVNYCYLYLVVQRIEENCVNLLEFHGIVYCYGCFRTVGYLLPDNSNIIVLFNMRAILYLPQRVNHINDRVVILSSSHEMNDVVDYVSENNSKRRRDGDATTEPPNKYSRFDISVAGPSTQRVFSIPHEIISVSDVSSTSDVDQLSLSDISDSNSNDFASTVSYGRSVVGLSPSLSVGNIEYNGVIVPDYDSVSEIDPLDCVDDIPIFPDFEEIFIHDSDFVLDSYLSERTVEEFLSNL